MAQLPDKCLLAVADMTLEDQEVIDNIHKINREICMKLPNTIFPKDSSQQIMKAITDTEALGLLKEVCFT